MKEIFCEIKSNDEPGSAFYVYTDGTLEYVDPFPNDAPPGNLEIWDSLRAIREDFARMRVDSIKQEPLHVALLTRGYRSRFPEAFATLCAFMKQKPPFESDEDDAPCRFIVVPRVENPWEINPNFNPMVLF